MYASYLVPKSTTAVQMQVHDTLVLLDKFSQASVFRVSHTLPPRPPPSVEIALLEPKPRGPPPAPNRLSAARSSTGG